MWSIPLPIIALLAPTAALAQSNSNTPPYNTSATNPWWPEYPVGRSMDDYMLNNNASESDLTGQSDIAKWIIEASNMWRSQFTSVPVTWNETAARLAQNHTNTCRWEHWGNDNLAQQYGSDPSMRFDVRSMTGMWADEWDYYPFSNPEREEYSHFTAMTWNASTTVGCGWNVNCSNDTAWPSKTYFVCNYWPPPNIMTKPPGILFAANIRNFTGWPVDEAKLSSINALAGQASPTATSVAVATETGAGSGSGNNGSGSGGNNNNGTSGSGNNNGGNGGDRARAASVAGVVSSVVFAVLGACLL